MPHRLRAHTVTTKPSMYNTLKLHACIQKALRRFSVALCKGNAYVLCAGPSFNLWLELEYRPGCGTRSCPA